MVFITFLPCDASGLRDICCRCVPARLSVCLYFIETTREIELFKVSAISKIRALHSGTLSQTLNLENLGTLKLQDWTLTDEFAGLDIAGLDTDGTDIDGLDIAELDIDGRLRRGGHSRTGQWRTGH